MILKPFLILARIGGRRWVVAELDTKEEAQAEMNRLESLKPVPWRPPRTRYSCYLLSTKAKEILGDSSASAQ